MRYQLKAKQLTDADKDEATKIARRLFGCYDWQGCFQQYDGRPGLESYINRSVLPRIRPEGSSWLVVEQQYLDENGWPRRKDEYEYEESTYFIKSF